VRAFATDSAQLSSAKLCTLVRTVLASFLTNPGQTGRQESAVHNLKLKVYPLLIAAIGVIAASGGYFRGR
jgi:hypothetical protein